MNYIKCLDGYCGALDCPKCHPENFDREEYYLDPEDENAEHNEDE